MKYLTTISSTLLVLTGLTSFAFGKSPRGGPTPQCVTAQANAAIQCGAATVAAGSCIVAPGPVTCSGAAIGAAECVQSLSTAANTWAPAPTPPAAPGN